LCLPEWEETVFGNIITVTVRRLGILRHGNHCGVSDLIKH
jgi:hypothetical protein